MKKFDLVNNQYTESELETIISENKLYLIDWDNISAVQKLSESFIEKYADKVSWPNISRYQKLSEPFIEKHVDKINWFFISNGQILSPEFIEKHADKLEWSKILLFQKLPENFIEKYAHKSIMSWHYISESQVLSEPFIEKHEDEVDWFYIFTRQKLSPEFIQKHADKLFVVNEFSDESGDLIPNQKDNRTIELKKQLIQNYANKHGLVYKDDYLYCFRNHDHNNRGFFNKTISYDKPGIYEDWKCNLNTDEKNSYGLGIWPKGNTKVRVKTEWWGIEVNDNDGKGRVWKFELL